MTLPIVRPAGRELILPPGAGAAADVREGVRTLIAPNPFDAGAAHFEVVEGGRYTIAQLVERAADAVGLPAAVMPNLIVRLRGHELPAECWRLVRPFSGELVEILVRPGDGNFWRGLLTLAVFVAAAYTGGLAAGLAEGGLGTVLGAAASASVAVVGNLLINALIPPPQFGQPDAPEALYTIDNASNEFIPWGPVPVLFGRHRVAPPQWGKPFETAPNDDQYITVLVTWGPAPVALSELKFGDTLVSSFDGIEVQHTGVVGETDGVTLYPGDVDQQSVGATIDQTWTQRTSTAGVDELRVILAFPKGLGEVASDGRSQSRSVTVQIEYRQLGDTTWETVFPTVLESDAAVASAEPTFDSRLGWSYGSNWSQYVADAIAAGAVTGDWTITRAKPGSPFLAERSWAVPAGEYEVRVTRTTAESTDNAVADQVVWRTLTGLTAGSPITDENMAGTCIRAKSTDELAGFLDTINAIAERHCPVLDPAAVAGRTAAEYNAVTSSDWTTEAASRNPADQALFALRGPHTPNPVADSEIDWPAWAAFWAWCEDEGFEFNYWFKVSSMRREDALHAICAAGRGFATRRDGKWTVVIDADTAERRAIFTPANTTNMRGQRTFPADVHGVRVAFANAAQNWQADERIITVDGYTEATATKLERLDLVGVTIEDDVWRLARFHLYTALGQTERWTFECDVDAMNLRMGSVVLLQHYALSVGVEGAYPRVIARTEAGGSVTHLTFDVPVPMQAGKTYAIAYQKVAGDVIDATKTADLVTAAGDQTTVAFASPIALADAPDIGDVAAYGETAAQTIDAVVRRIRDVGNFRFEVECSAFAAERFAADQGAVPAFDTGVTLPAYSAPPTPVYVSFAADENGISVSFEVAEHSADRVAKFEVSWREASTDGGEVDWIPAASLGPNERTAAIPPGVPGRFYDVRIRAVDTAGRYSTALIVEDLPADDTLAAPTGCVVTPTTQASGVGAEIPVFLVSCDASTNAAVELIEVELGAPGANPATDSAWDTVQIMSAGAPNAIVTGLVPGREYDVAFRARSGRGVLSGRTVVASVTASSVLTVISVIDDAITQGKLADAAVTAAKLAAAAVGEDALADGSVVADKLAANSVTASKLFLTDWNNYVFNPGMDNGGDGWTIASGSGYFSSNAAFSSGFGYNLTTTGYIEQSDHYIAAKPGDILRYSFEAYGNGASPDARVQIVHYDADKVYNGTLVHGVHTIAGFVDTYTGLITVGGSDTAYIRIRCRSGDLGAGATFLSFSSVYVFKANAAELIVDGTITGVMMQADTITAQQIAANTLTAAEMAAGTITGSLIAADAITGTLIAADTIVTTNLQAGAVTNAAVTLTSSALSISDNVWTTIAQVALTVGDGSVFVYGDFEYDAEDDEGGPAGEHYMRIGIQLTRSGNILREVFEDINMHTNDWTYGLGSGLMNAGAYETPGAATHTYNLKAAINANQLRTIGERVIFAVEYKR